MLDISRRWGKSTVMLLICVEECIRNKRHRVPYCAGTHDMVRTILGPLFDELLVDCPPKLRPTRFKSEHRWAFGSGSELILVGMDVNPDRARGRHLDFCAIDEAGFIQDLEYVMTSVLYPQMHMREHARILMGSTPPISPQHAWSRVYVPQAQAKKVYVHRTIEDNPMLSAKELDEFIGEAGGRKAVACRREYFAQHVADDTLAIIPEFRDVESEVIVEAEPPAWSDCYVSMDPGWKDATGILFGYWDFRNAHLYIEEEILETQKTSGELAEMILATEENLWKDRRRFHKGRNEVLGQPYMRISDNELRLIEDLAMDHNLRFVPTAKDNLDQQINAVRIAFQEKKIRIHPRCVNLKRQLLNGVWQNSKRVNFAREGAFGHFDLIAALIYLWRNLQTWHNPYPDSLWNKDTSNKWVGREDRRNGRGKADKFGSKWRRNPRKTGSRTR